jgi:hypothetical protein
MVEVLDSLMGCDLGNLCAKVQWKICKWKLKTSTTLRGNRRERDDTNVTNDDVFRLVCSVYLRPILVVCADMTHSPWENPAPIHLWGSYRLRKKILQTVTQTFHFSLRFSYRIWYYLGHDFLTLLPYSHYFTEHGRKN